MIGENVVNQGERGDSLFVIGRGQVDVIERGNDGAERVLARLMSGDFFGETALLYPQPRTATVRAATPCTLLELSTERLAPVLENAPLLRDALEKVYRERVLHTILSQVPRFMELSSEERDEIAFRMKRITVHEEGTLETGSEGAFIVLGTGEAEIERDGKVEAELISGEFFESRVGEVIRAITDIELYMLDRDSKV